MSEQTTLPEIKKLESVLTLAEANLPKMKLGSERAVSAMKAITEITSEEEFEQANDLLVKVKDAYVKINALRTEITSPVDEVKKYLMEFERPLGDDKNSEYTRVRAIMTAYRQRELDKKKEIEAAAAKKKLVEDHIIDLRAVVLKNLHELLLNKTKQADSGSAEYLKKSTLEDFDARADTFMKMKPVLKPADYANCFSVNANPELIPKNDVADLIAKFKEEEPFDKWNEKIVEAATPIVNEWRAKIPDLKQQLIDLKNATDQNERDKLLAKQKEEADSEAARRSAILDEQNLAASREIEAQSNLGKLENSFVEQAVVQQAGDTGAVKYVLKFGSDHKLMPKAFMNIIYQCLAHPDFPGIQKRDKNDKLVVDDKGRPEYITAVQYWITFFMDNCDAAIEGTNIYEDSKITIRK